MSKFSARITFNDEQNPLTVEVGAGNFASLIISIDGCLKNQFYPHLLGRLGAPGEPVEEFLKWRFSWSPPDIGQSEPGTYLNQTEESDEVPDPFFRRWEAL